MILSSQASAIKMEILCHIDSVILYIHIFVEDIVVAMNDKWV